MNISLVIALFFVIPSSDPASVVGDYGCNVGMKCRYDLSEISQTDRSVVYLPLVTRSLMSHTNFVLSPEELVNSVNKALWFTLMVEDLPDNATLFARIVFDETQVMVVDEEEWSPGIQVLGSESLSIITHVGEGHIDIQAYEVADVGERERVLVRFRVRGNTPGVLTIRLSDTFVVDGDWNEIPSDSTSQFATILAKPARDAGECPSVLNDGIKSLPVFGEPSSISGSSNAEYNLYLRGWVLTNATPHIIEYPGPADPKAPQLSSLTPSLSTQLVNIEFSAVGRVRNWDVRTNSPGDPIIEWNASLVGIPVRINDVLHLPVSGYDIGSGFGAIVLYADERQIALKYTREDNVVAGYTLHVVGICVDSALLTLYKSLEADGRKHLPALRMGDPLGIAIDDEVLVAIRDNGQFMDPRIRKDWWQSN